MYFAPQHLRAIDLAARAASQAYQPILAGEPTPLTLYSIDASGLPHSELPGAPLETVRARLHAGGGGDHGQFLLCELAARFDDSAAERGLFIEFGQSCGTLHGLLLALPYITRQDGKRLPGMIQVRHCPDRLRTQVDELLPRFARSLQDSPGGKAWVRALEYDRLAPPSVAAFEATRQAVDALCPALAPDDPAADCNDAAARHLDALVERSPFEHGIAYRKALYQLGLDLSAASLLRVDQLLEQLKPTLTADAAAFSAQPANRNFLHLLAFYIGTVVAQESGSQVDWLTPVQLHQHYGFRPNAAPPPGSTLAAVFNHREIHFPLALLQERLFGACDSAAFRAELQALGCRAAASRARRLQDDMAPVQRRINLARDSDPGYFVTPRPFWADGEDIDLWFQNVGALYQGGRLVWGLITQANYQMFEAGENNCPGVVLYDLRGIPGSEELQQASSRLAAYKCTRPFDHRLRFLADLLTEEHTNFFGLPLPLRLSSADLRLSVIYFDRQHLPGGILHSNLVPLLIHDAYPGIVSVLPERFWSEEIAAQCRRHGWPV